MTTVTDRVQRAREALQHAELRTGARSMPVRTSRVPSIVPVTSAPVTSAPVTSAAAWGGTGRAGHPDRPPLAVAAVLSPLLPEGALHRGGTLVVTGSTSLVLALVARASREGSWVAVVGLPGVGVLAAQQAGVELDRLALVPHPGPEAPTVLAALLDGVDVVIVGAGAAIVDSDRRRLMARARERGAVLLSTTRWPGAQLVLAAEPAGWTGLGLGYGHLRSHRWTVTRGGRGSAGRVVLAEVVLPVREHEGAQAGPLGQIPAMAPAAVVSAAVAPAVAPAAAGSTLRLVG